MLVVASEVLDAEMTTSKSADHIDSLRRRLAGGLPHTAVNFQPRIDATGTPRASATLDFKLSDSVCVAGLAALKVNVILVVIVSTLLGAGVTVGQNVGAGIGADVGTCDGSAVDCSDGSAVGCSVGVKDGSDVGCSVGASDGSAVG